MPLVPFMSLNISNLLSPSTPFTQLHGDQIVPLKISNRWQDVYLPKWSLSNVLGVAKRNREH